MRVVLVLPAESDAASIAAAWHDGDPAAVIDLCPVSRSGPGFLTCLAGVAPVELAPGVRSTGPQAAGPRATEDPRPTLYVDAASIASGSTTAVGHALAHALRTGPARVVIATGRGVAAGSTVPDAGTGLFAALAEDSRSSVPVAGGRAEDRGAGHGAGWPIADLDALRAARAAVVGPELIAAVGDDTALVGPSGLSVRRRDQGLDPAEAERQERVLAGYAHTLTQVAQEWASGGGDLGIRTQLPLAGHAGHDHNGGDRTRPQTLPGAGTGGGLGYALALLGARLWPAAEVVADAVGLSERLACADVVAVWTERLDADEMVNGLVRLCAERAADTGIPVVVLTDEAQPGRREWSAAGISAVYETGADLAARVRAVARTWSGM